MVALGYAALRDGYFARPVVEFFSHGGTAYEAVTEAAWGGKRGGNLRVFLEISRADADALRTIYADDIIVAPDSSLVGE